jgi:choline dehydrogenase-like flavoprotein
MSTESHFNFIIVGGGTAGCVLASRLAERQPSLSILLIEAGPDVTNHPHVAKPSDNSLLIGSNVDWNDLTVPQQHLDNRQIYNGSAKALSGSVAINFGMNSLGDETTELIIKIRRLVSW